MGKAAAAILVVLCTVIAVAVAHVLFLLESYVALFGWMRIIVLGAATLGVMGLVLLPLGMFVDRSIVQFRVFMRAAIEDGGSDRSADVPRILAPLVDAFHSSIQAVLQRERTLAHDLGDLRISHRIIETERDQLHGVLHALRDAVIVTDPFDEIVTLNRAAGEALCLNIDEAARTPIDRVIGDQRVCQLIRETRELRDPADTRSVEHDIVAGETTVPYQIMLSSLENNRGEVGAVVTILHDLRREREIAQMKSDFVSKVSHELRTPLSSIRAYVEMLLDGEANDEDARAEFYGIIQNEADRLNRMIDTMLNISRIEAGIVQIDRELVDLRELLDRAAETLEPQAVEKKISLSVKAAPVDLTVEGDTDMLYQVVLNLVSNAIKYTPDGGRIQLAADSDNLTRSIVVNVTDTGLGVPPDSLPRLFEKFYRIESFKRVAKGTGLGLSLCKHIVETVHHGQIGVESKLGMGSKFWFTVPMKFTGAKAA